MQKKSLIRILYNFFVYLCCLAFIAFLFLVLQFPKQFPYFEGEDFWFIYLFPVFILGLVILREKFFYTRAQQEAEWIAQLLEEEAEQTEQEE